MQTVDLLLGHVPPPFPHPMHPLFSRGYGVGREGSFVLCGAGMPGMPSMTQEEMLAATLAGSGPKKVSQGKVRRKKGQSRGFAELAGLRN